MAHSLREAVIYANSNADVSEITFKSGLTGTIQLGSSLTINTSMNVTATSTQSITVRGSGVGAFRHLHRQLWEHSAVAQFNPQQRQLRGGQQWSLEDESLHSQ